MNNKPKCKTQNNKNPRNNMEENLDNHGDEEDFLDTASLV